MASKIKFIPLVHIGIAQPTDKVIPINDRDFDTADTQLMSRGPILPDQHQELLHVHFYSYQLGHHDVL